MGSGGKIDREAICAPVRQPKPLDSTIRPLITVLLSLVVVELASAQGRTWVVDDNGPADFADIAAGVSVVADGDLLLTSLGRKEPAWHVQTLVAESFAKGRPGRIFANRSSPSERSHPSLERVRPQVGAPRKDRALDDGQGQWHAVC